MNAPVLYPSLSSAAQISFDTETMDPNLEDLGPGVYRKDSKLLGVSLSDGEGFSEYYNIGHYDCSSEVRNRNIAYLREQLRSDVPKMGHTIMYDIDWLENSGHDIKVKGKLGSVDVAEALIDETQLEYNLDFLGKKYLGIGKEKNEIDKFCEDNRLKGDSRKWLWKMPYELVRKYAKQDADLPARIFQLQLPILESQDLMPVYEIENQIIRPLILMRKTGTRIDTRARDKNGLMIQNMIETSRNKLFNDHGVFNPNSAMQVAKVLDRKGIAYPLTEPTQKPDGSWTAGGKPAINAFFFKRYEEEQPLVKEIYNLRKMQHHLDSFIMGSHVKFVGEDGLMHPQFFNLRNDSLGALKGTRSGRLSGANPNLQQQPSLSYDEYWGKICRADFIPFENCWWGSMDYSQIEYKFLAHFAVGEGAEALRRAYINNPGTDYHKFIEELTGLKRRLAKNLNFGVAFGMGANHMCELFGWDLDYAYEILNIYHSKAPYIKETMKLVEKVAKKRGYIRTFLKRRSRLVNPKKAYAMFCRLLQGSAADLIKTAIVKSYEAGLFDILYPHATVHDELDVSVPKTRVGIEAFREMKHIMETALEIAVPITAKPEIGKNWASLVSVVSTAEEKEKKGEGAMTWDDMERSIV